jgi:hypothetical protein
MRTPDIVSPRDQALSLAILKDLRKLSIRQY